MPFVGLLGDNRCRESLRDMSRVQEWSLGEAIRGPDVTVIERNFLYGPQAPASSDSWFPKLLCYWLAPLLTSSPLVLPSRSTLDLHHFWLLRLLYSWVAPLPTRTTSNSSASYAPESIRSRLTSLLTLSLPVLPSHFTPDSHHFWLFCFLYSRVAPLSTRTLPDFLRISCVGFYPYHMPPAQVVRQECWYVWRHGAYPH